MTTMTHFDITLKNLNINIYILQFHQTYIIYNLILLFFI